MQMYIHAAAEASRQYLLTAREREILRLMAAGLTNPQIAARLVIGAGTVKTHTLNIYRKLEVANRTQAIVRAQQLGLLRLRNTNLPAHLLDDSGTAFSKPGLSVLRKRRAKV